MRSYSAFKVVYSAIALRISCSCGLGGAEEEDELLGLEDELLGLEEELLGLDEVLGLEEPLDSDEVPDVDGREEEDGLGCPASIPGPALAEEEESVWELLSLRESEEDCCERLADALSETL